MQIEKKHTPHNDYNLIDEFKDVVGEWLPCPNCKLMPKVWMYDNGCHTGCGCRISRYNHFTIYAESILSHVKNNDGSLKDYDDDELRKNWNKWALTGEIVFIPQNGRW